MYRSMMALQLLVAVIWGGTWIAGRMAALEASPFMVAGWRIIIASSILGYLVWRQLGKISFPKEQKKYIFLMALVGVCGYALCFFYGLKFVQPGRAALVVALNPVMVAIGAWVFMGEPLSLRKWCGVSIALFGSLVILGHGDPLSLFRGEINHGELFILGCVATWTAYTLLGRKVSKDVSPLLMTFHASWMGGLMLWGIGLLDGSLRTMPSFSWQGWGSIVYLGVLGSGLAYVWYAQGLKVLGAARTAVFINFVPMSAVLFSAVLLHEQLQWQSIVGGLIVLIGVVLTTYEKMVPKVIVA
jgi:drug/metabolite transporter (DMT)-like permease